MKKIAFGVLGFLIASIATHAWGGLVDDGHNLHGARVPILLYHRFGPVASDSMTLTTAHFESQLQYIRDHGFSVIRLRRLVDHFLGKAVSIPPRAVVMTADDGHRSVYTDMFPLLRKYRMPATFFVYPSAVSNASYALTWEQLREMKESGYVDIQSHTYWHPNFTQEKKRLTPGQYEDFVEMQLKKSRERLEKRLDVRVDMLAWPFGIYDDALLDKAANAGYVAGFTIERRDANISENILALPRYLIVDAAWEPGAILGLRP